MTKEDIVPDWARVLVRDNFGPFPQGQGPRRFTMRLCLTCNGTLNDRFEILAHPLVEPLIRDVAQRFTRAHQAIVAHWILKTSLMDHFEVAVRNGDDSFAEQIRRVVLYMMKHEASPLAFSVRTMRVGTPVEPSRVGPADGELVPQPPPSIMYHAVPYLGHLGWELVVADELVIWEFVARTQDNGWFVRIWPPQTPHAQVPPRRILRRSDLDRMHNLWNTLPDSKEHIRELWNPDHDW